MQALDDVTAAIESLTLPESSLLQTQLAPVGLQMLRDVLARDWEALRQSGSVSLDVGRSGFEMRAAEIAERRRRILAASRDYALSRLDEVDPDLFAQGGEGDDDLSTLVKQFATQIADSRKRHDEALESTFDADLALAYAVHGLKALSYAGFNMAFGRDEPAAEATAGDAAEETASAFAGDVRQGLLAAHGAVQSGADGPALDESLAHAATALEASVPAFYAALAPHVRAYLAAVEEGAVGRTDMLGRALARANDAWREGVCAYAALHRLRMLLLRFGRTGEARMLVERAAELAFDGPVPDGVDTAIADVATRDDGAFVELRGVVRRIDHDTLSDGTLVSRIVLGASNGASEIPCAARFAHLGRMGIGVGSYMRLNGAKQDQVTVLDGAPGVTIDQLSHVELAKTSWRHALLRLAEPYFPRWRHKLNIAWSPMPHVAPTRDGIRGGANEFIYSPFLR